MKISLNWIKDFVNLDGVTVEDIDKNINQMCAEIENFEIKGKDTQGVVFGKILKIENHPESTKLHVLSVDVGSEVLQIVCGAPNVRKGMVTCVAKVGGKVCGHKIGVAKLAGVLSYGMCCSEEELGIGSDNSGICDIDFKVKLGQDIKEVLPIDDVVLEIDNKTLTNRPDLWGHYGFAREFSAIFKRKLKPLEMLDLNKFEGLESVKIKVETDKCLRYSAMSVENVTVKTSPLAMKIRLNYAGMRDINLLADITNYIMLELGQPMHAFDNRKVSSIIVSTAKAGDKILTLENEEHEVPEGSVVICDGHKTTVAIAGVKGGLKSSISDKTDSVLFESATFDASSIRKTSRTIGLITDASLRYEKSLDPELTKIALARIIFLLSKIDKNIIVTSCFSDCYKVKLPKIEIDVTKDFISKRIGAIVAESKIIEILNSLGFVCKKKKDVIHCVVPSFRATKDISIKEDLVEEVARMLNYQTIDEKSLMFEVAPVLQETEHTFEYAMKLLLAEKYGANEVHSYIWHYEDFCKEHKIDCKPVLKLLDSKNAGQSGIRTMIVPTLLKFVSENKEEQGGEIKIFEIGRCVSSLSEQGLAVEDKNLAVVFASHCDQEALFFNLKTAIVDFAENYLGANLEFEKATDIPNFMHKVNTCNVCFNGEVLGYLGVVSPITSKVIDKKLNIVACEIDFRKLCKIKGYPKKIKVPSKLQSVHLDLNFLVDKNRTYAEISKILSKIRSKLLVGYHLVEVFESETLGNKKSMLFNFEINGKDHTLTGSEIDTFMNDVIALMAKNNCPLR